MLLEDHLKYRVGNINHGIFWKFTTDEMYNDLSLVANQITRSGPMTYFALLEEEVRVGRFLFICTLESALTELLVKSVLIRVTSYVGKMLSSIRYECNTVYHSNLVQFTKIS